MSRKRSVYLVGLMVVIAAIAVPVSSAAARHRAVRKPNLQVSQGKVVLRGGRVRGSFTVRNSGRATAGRSRASLTMVVAERRRSLEVFRVAQLKPHAQIKVAVSVRLPSAVPTGRYRILACADSSRVIRESSERDNCARVGTLAVTSSSSSSGASGTTGTSTTGASTPAGTSTGPGTTTAPSPAATAPTTTPTTPTTPAAGTPTEPQPGPTQAPTAPMTVSPDTPTLVNDAYDGMTGSYYVDIPPTYNPTGATPMRLLVWMHGCGGYAEGDSYEITASNTLNSQGQPQTDDSRDFISISIGGADDACWDPDTDVEQVLMAIADVTTHFNIDRRHIFIGGYSSGGDLAYRTIFYNADEFAGILTVNTNPFRDTGSTEAQSLAAAAWKFNIAHVAHSEDEEYHVNACTDCLSGGGNDPGVTPAMNDLFAAGYTVKYTIEHGDHFDDDNFQAGTGTMYDWRQYVRPYIDQPGWQSPG
jgi:predicted esterase